MRTSDRICRSGILYVTYTPLNSKQENIGSLHKPTAGHAVIETVENQFLAVGGDAKLNQKCYLDQSLDCQFYNSIGKVSKEISSPTVDYKSTYKVNSELLTPKTAKSKLS